MTAVKMLTLRNIRLFFRDKASVFFSLLSAIILIGLYALFLGDVMVSGMEAVGDGVAEVVNRWIVSGLMAVTSITSVMGAYGTLVDDRHTKISKDFSTAPVQRAAIAAGYMISSFCVGVVITLVTMAAGELYIVSKGGSWMSLSQLASLVGITGLSVLANSAIVLFIVSFFNSTGAFGAASTILGTLIGFLTGIYIPIGQLPSSVQWVIKFFPVSHAAALIRQVAMGPVMDASMQGAPESMVTQVKTFMGVVFDYNGYIATPWHSILALVATAVIFYVLGIWRISRKLR